MPKRSKIPALVPAMNGTEFERAINKLGFSQVGVGRFFGRDARTVRRLIAGAPVAAELALALRLMVRFKVEPPEECKS